MFDNIFLWIFFQSIEKFAASVKDSEDRIDVLINNAGMAGDLGARYVIFQILGMDGAVIRKQTG